ncbi:MAG: hypothetical protein AABX70_03555 [Nanoarchaeota archaeon]
MIKLGVVGSAFQLTKEEIEIAHEVGKELLKNELDVLICFDPESLPMEMCKEIAKVKKPTCFVCDKREEKEAKKLGFQALNTNLPRMSRELVFVKNTDALLVLGGGSGTLMEVTFAYQMGKPVFVLEEIKGTVDMFKDKFLDKRERLKIQAIRLNQVSQIPSKR